LKTKGEEFTESSVEQPTDALHPLLQALMNNPKKKRGVTYRDLTADNDKTTTTTTGSNDHLLEAYPFTHGRRENPNLEKAWAYFDHVALSRYVVASNDDKEGKPKKIALVRAFRKLIGKAKKLLQRTEPGECHLHTELYEPVFTPHGPLGDFGLGIGLYFSTLRALTVLTLLTGLLNIPNFLHFSSSDYNRGLSNFNSFLY
jgi:hypothetical protein